MTTNRDVAMPRYALELVIVVLFLLWLFGEFLSPFDGNLIHFLPVVLVMLVVIRLLMGRKVPD